MVKDDRRSQTDNGLVRALVMVRGIVQGVGFRPFVYRIATAYGLAGLVLNSTEGVEIEVEGAASAVADFLGELSRNAPAAASIHRLDVQYLPAAGYTTFIIENSHDGASGFPLVSPDIATCPDCLAELLDPRDRRHRYPFINCTGCGPRFTIVEGVPYDRPRTTMKHFALCATCQREYDDPHNRRFHAQPNACPECGPMVWLAEPARGPSGLDSSGHNDPNPGPLPPGAGIGTEGDGIDPIVAVRRLLKDGKILAIKGLGGFHLACDATNAAAVAELRVRKGRMAKPFAIMVPDVATAKQVCLVNDAEERLLASARRPIVLLERRPGGTVASDVAPGSKTLGVLLPYMPIHHLLLEPTAELGFDALVMTSGNLSEEPIAKDNDEALNTLSALADCFLLHDRPIHLRCDDSVARVYAGQETIIRRSRGYAPRPVRLAFGLERVLACGGELKSTFCLTDDHYAFLSQHIGDLDNQETLDFYGQTVEHFVRTFDLSPCLIAHDQHPDYLSTRYALERAGEASILAVGVQHHHAHIASCMAENGLSGPVIGVAFDGTGYGPDGTIWGGEFLVADYRGFERVAHLRPLPLPGGEAAIRKPYRMALSYLIAAYGDDLPEINLLAGVDRRELETIKAQVARGLNSPLTSSCGRLFDAVSALLGIRREISYEGQAAIELETAAASDVTDAYDFGLTLASEPINPAPVIRLIVDDLQRGEEVEVIATRFHNGVARMIADICVLLRKDRAFGLNRVCLSGGVFQNQLLLSGALAGLRREGFDVYIHHQVPCNDGGISLGQAVVASEQVRQHA